MSNFYNTMLRGTKVYIEDNLKIQGVYFLIQNSNVVYIGKTIDMKARLFDHITNKKRKFDECYMYKVENKADMGILELIMIDKYKPRDNKADKHKGCNITYSIDIDMELIVEEVIKIKFKRYTDDT